MAFVQPSLGYDGTVSETQIARMAHNFGADYAVEGAADWKVTAVAGQDRTVAIAPGTGYGHFVRDTTDSIATIQLATITSGTRWDLIVCRRDWQPPGGVSTFEKVQGTSSKVIPSGRLVGPGVKDDQPLALVQVTAGQTLPTAIVDLRTWPSKVITASDLLALPNAALGTEAVVSGTRYRRELDNTNNVAWVIAGVGQWQDFYPYLYTNMSTTPVAIAAVIDYARWRMLDAGTVQAQVSVTRTAGQTTQGGFGVSLPVRGAYRSLNCGTLIVAGSNPPAAQSGIAQMSADASKLIPVAMTNGYLDVVPTNTVRYSVTYEV